MGRFDRLLSLVNLLAGSRRRSLEELATQLETSPRSIYRDLAALEERGIPVERVDGTYRLLDGATLRPLALTEVERLVLSAALETPSLRRQPFGRTTRELRAKLQAAVKIDDSRVAVVSGPDRSGELGAPIVEALEDAIRTAHSVSILYTSLTTGEAKWRAIDPWLLFHRADAWYVAARCHEHDDPRMFRLDRITNVLPIGTTFEKPADFDVDRWLATSWGIFQGEGTHEVVVVFEASVAPLIEHAQHHASESKRRIADGRIEYRATIASLDELARWIVAFGGAARAVEPQELIEKVRDLAAGALLAHEGRRSAAPSRPQSTARKVSRSGDRN